MYSIANLLRVKTADYWVYLRMELRIQSFISPESQMELPKY
jgi:hypothetical protein